MLIILYHHLLFSLLLTYVYYFFFMSFYSFASFIFFSFVFFICYLPFLFFQFLHLYLVSFFLFVFFFKQKPAYEMRISDWSSDVCSSDLTATMLLLDAQGRLRSTLDIHESAGITIGKVRRVLGDGNDGAATGT